MDLPSLWFSYLWIGKFYKDWLEMSYNAQLNFIKIKYHLLSITRLQSRSFVSLQCSSYKLNGVVLFASFQQICIWGSSSLLDFLFGQIFLVYVDVVSVPDRLWPCLQSNVFHTIPKQTRARKLIILSWRLNCIS